jgi:hypothetical protein
MMAQEVGDKFFANKSLAGKIDDDTLVMEIVFRGVCSEEKQICFFCVQVFVQACCADESQ